MRFREPTTIGRSLVIGAGGTAEKSGVCSERDYRAYACVYLTGGTGFYTDTRNGRVTVGAGDLFVLFPGLVHSYGPIDGGTWAEVWFGCRGPLFAALESEGLISRDRPVLHPGVDEGLIARFDALVGAVDRRAGTSDAVLAARAHLLIAEIATADAAPSPTSLVARARAAMSANLRQPLDLQQVAKRLGVGYDTLRRAFHADTGTSPGRWRLLRKIERAKELLVTDETLDAIADQAGFCDRFFFARQFKSVVGVPPGRWRADTLGR
ncbi:MAG: AraC family transcriptional regulator [Planctomycetota bacterium]